MAIADCRALTRLGQPGCVLTAVALLQVRCTWEIDGFGLVRMSQQHKQHHKGCGLASLRLHADLKQHRVYAVSYAAVQRYNLDFLACPSNLHTSLPESCFGPVGWVTKCAVQRATLGLLTPHLELSPT